MARLLEIEMIFAFVFLAVVLTIIWIRLGKPKVWK